MAYQYTISTRVGGRSLKSMSKLITRAHGKCSGLCNSKKKTLLIYSAFEITTIFLTIKGNMAVVEIIMTSETQHKQIREIPFSQQSNLSLIYSYNILGPI